MCVVDLDQCDCDCHRSEFGVSHVMACCQECRVCGARIAYGFRDHMKKHTDAVAEAVREVRGEDSLITTRP